MASQEGTQACSKCLGCGYPSPLEAMKDGPREKILYVTCIRPSTPSGQKPSDGKPDCLSVVDVDPKSETFCKVIHRVQFTNVGDEIHHFGWNACSSCYGEEGITRSKLVVLSLRSSRIYVIDVSKDERAPTLFKVIEPEEIIDKAGCTAPHTTHCLPTREVMVSMLGDRNGNAKGSFLLLDSETFEVKGTWEGEGNSTPYGYSFWYQPYHNVMISSEWGAPNAFLDGFNPIHVKEGKYGRSLHIWDWKERSHKQTIDLGPNGMFSFEVRFLHDPKEAQGYVGTALSSNVFRFFRKENGEWDTEQVITVEPIKASGWILPEVPGLMTDNLISLDDRFLYLTLYLHGEVRQYDISDRSNPKLVGRLFLGGLFRKGTSVHPYSDADMPEGGPDPVVLKGKTFLGGPHKMQLSLDGKRLYVTNNLLSRWDIQFYPEMVQNGSMCVQIDVDTEKGGLTLNENFLVDFGEDPDGPTLAHEMRYPGGDCTSDVWLAKD